MLTLLPFSAQTGHDASGSTCTTHFLALTLVFHCSWPRLKPDNRHRRARCGRMKRDGGAESPPCSQHGCLPVQDWFLWPGFLRTSIFLGPGAGTPACRDLCFKRRNREVFLVFFSGALAPLCPIHGMLLLSEISDVSTQIKVRLNVSTAEIPHGSRWKGGTSSQPSAFSPSLLVSLPKSGSKASIYSVFSVHSIQLSQLADGKTEA